MGLSIMRMRRAIYTGRRSIASLGASPLQSHDGSFFSLDVRLMDNLDIAKDVCDLLEGLALSLGVRESKHDRAEEVGEDEEDLIHLVRFPFVVIE